MRLIEHLYFISSKESGHAGILVSLFRLLFLKFCWLGRQSLSGVLSLTHITKNETRLGRFRFSDYQDLIPTGRKIMIKSWIIVPTIL
jgi:hypothetical protein